MWIRQPHCFAVVAAAGIWTKTRALRKFSYKLTAIWGLSKIMVPENALTPRVREPFAPFRALSRPSRIGTWDYDQVFVYLRFINNGIQTFREPYAALSRLSPLQQNIHIHICRCHSDTKSLAWVLGRLPYAKMSVPCQRHLSTGHILLAASCGQRMLVHSWPGFKAIHQSN